MGECACAQVESTAFSLLSWVDLIEMDRFLSCGPLYGLLLGWQWRLSPRGDSEPRFRPKGPGHLCCSAASLPFFVVSRWETLVALVADWDRATRRAGGDEELQ
jgi:hypothetical protein